MPFPYENDTSGAGALELIAQVLKRFGYGRFGTMKDSDDDELIVKFSARGKDVTGKASMCGYAAAWLKERPHGRRSKTRARCGGGAHTLSNCPWLLEK